MLTKIYQKLQARVNALSNLVAGSRNYYQFFRQNFYLALKLFFWEVLFSFVKFLIVIIKSPASSFFILKQSQVQGACDYSYTEHILYQKKIKLFSLAGLSAVVGTSLMISFIFTYILPGLYLASARTDSWVQSDWSQGLDTVTFPSDPDNKTNWKKYYYKDDQTIADSDNIRSGIAASSLIETSDADFGAGASSGMLGISNNSLILDLPE